VTPQPLRRTRGRARAATLAVPLLVVLWLALSGGPVVRVAPTAAQAVPAPEGVFTATGSCIGQCPVTVGPHGASVPSILLASGKVLVATGPQPPDITHPSQLYDPSTGTWAATGACEQCAGEGTLLALLGTGKVLATGGISPNPANVPEGQQGLTNVANVYDPATGTWSPTAPMKFSRLGHSATTLASGRVLVAGGCLTTCTETGHDDPAATAEIYDPASGAWTQTGDMAVGRADHTATLLTDGRVLVVGGTDTRTRPLGQAELFDPGTGAWTATEGLANPRFMHTATRLGDGRVLVAAGRSGAAGLNDSVVYDPATGTWSPQPAVLTATRRSASAALLPNGKVLVVGGIDSAEADNVVDLYDPATNQWQPAGRMIDKRDPTTAALLPPGPVSTCGVNCGRVLVAGGCCDPNGFAYAASELYAPRPVVTGVDPATGPADGGTVVTLTGTGLASATEVQFAGNPGTALTHDPTSPDTKLTVTTPFLRPGTGAEVRVVAAGGSSEASLTPRFLPAGAPDTTSTSAVATTTTVLAATTTTVGAGATTTTVAAGATTSTTTTAGATTTTTSRGVAGTGSSPGGGDPPTATTGGSGSPGAGSDPGGTAADAVSTAATGRRGPLVRTGDDLRGKLAVATLALLLGQAALLGSRVKRDL